MTPALLWTGGFLIVLLLIALGFQFIRHTSKKQNLFKIHQAAQDFVNSTTPDIKAESEAKMIWLKIVKSNGYLKSLHNKGSQILLGDSSMGVSIFLKDAARFTNDQFNTHQHYAAYINTWEAVNIAHEHEDIAFPEDVYRAILTSNINPLLLSIEEKLGEKKYLESGLPELDLQLKALLDNTIIEMPTVEIARTLNEIWSIVGIAYFRLFLDRLSSVNAEQMPLIIDLLMRTLQQSGKADLVIGGGSDDLILIRDTPEGPIGVQVGHDIFISLNLEDILIPATDNLDDVYLGNSPRGEFIKVILKDLPSGVKAVTMSDFENNLFEPADGWKFLFAATRGDVDKIVETIPLIIQDYNDNHKKISRERVFTILKT